MKKKPAEQFVASEPSNDLAANIKSASRRNRKLRFQNRTFCAPVVDAPAVLKHYFTMSSLVEIEKAAEALPPEQKEKLILFLGARLREASRNGRHKPSPAERAADLQRWAASHERGPGLPDSAVGRDAIYD